MKPHEEQEITQYKLLGDHIEEMSKKLKFDRLVQLIEKTTGEKCNCASRRDRLNTLHQQMRDLLGLK